MFLFDTSTESIVSEAVKAFADADGKLIGEADRANSGASSGFGSEVFSELAVGVDLAFASDGVQDKSRSA